MNRNLFLGKSVSGDVLGATVEVASRDLLTHGLIVGMTGSGKTGIAVAMIEEILRGGVPVLAIDPKGDLGNLLLTFGDLSPTAFEPWVDADSARRDGKTVPQAAEEAAATWTKGLAEWGLIAADVAALSQARDAVIYTPGSSSGIPLSVLQSLEAPAGRFDDGAEDHRDEIAGIVSGLLGLLGVDADPLQSREFILLSSIIEHNWRASKSLTIEDLIGAIADPPFEKLGALPVSTVYPKKDRTALMMQLNNLLASPQFQAWRQGEPLDIASMLRAPDGRPRLSIVYTAHLADAERIFVTALILDKVKSWMRKQGGTTELRAVVYMDEIFGYFPPHPANPPTKKPLLTLLKQARAQGVGVVLATQNPVDLDYKGLSNMGLWLVGKLQTDNDRARLMDGLSAAGLEAKQAETLLGATRKRVFLLHDVHRGKPELVHSRFAMSYLRGPLTREDVERLMADRKKASPQKPAVSAAAAGPSGPPPLPAPYKHFYFSKYSGQNAEPHLLIKYACKMKDVDEIIGARLYPLGCSAAAEILDGEHIELEDGDASVSGQAPADGLRFTDLPEFVSVGGAKEIEKGVKDRLASEFSFKVFVDAATKLTSTPGETREAFVSRVAAAASGNTKAAQLQTKLAKKELDLKKALEDLEGREQEKKMSMLKGALEVGGSLLGGLFGGGRKGSAISAIKKGASAMSGVTSKNRMEDNAEAKVAILQEEIAKMKEEMGSLGEIDPGRFEEKTVAATKAGTKLLRTEIVWVY